MNLTEWEIHLQLKRLLDSCQTLPLKKKDKYVIFSDLHIGNRTSRDDFNRNGEMLTRVLKEHYFPQGYTLILNGDIEELQKFSINLIYERWRDFFDAVMEFKKKNRLIKLIGNHDLELQAHPKVGINEGLIEGLRFSWNGHTIFMVHGHQASGLFTKYNWFVGGILKYLAYPLHIKNRSAAHDSKRKYMVEKRIYKFSEQMGILSIIGHTHRPLFESHSKRDSLRFSIEILLRDYPDMSKKQKGETRTKIEHLREELSNLSKKERKGFKTPSFYNENILLPCLFNSGCAIGKRGMTGIELTGECITLVHWFDRSKKIKKYWEKGPVYAHPESNIRKRIINEDQLGYIFNRITLLSPGKGLMDKD